MMNKQTRRFCFANAFLLVLTLSFGKQSFAQSSEANFKQGEAIETLSQIPSDRQRIATTLPITYLLTQALIQETNLQVDYLPTKRYPVNRIGYWLQKKLPQKLEQLPQYSALITVASVWPELEVYPTLRQSNIRIVPIDAAFQLKPGGARINQQTFSLKQGDKASDYFWLNPTNLKVMNNIIAEDLIRLWPQYRQSIQRNQSHNEKQISLFALDLDDALWQQGWEAICSQQPELNPLLYALSLPVLEFAKENPDRKESSGSKERDREGDKNSENIGDKQSDNCLWVTDQNVKNQDSKAKTIWTLNSLKKMTTSNFQQWLEDNLVSLKSSHT